MNAPEFMYVVMRERHCWMLELHQRCPIAAYFDKAEAERHAAAAQDAVAVALDELTSYRKAPAPQIILALDPTCPLSEDINVGYSVEEVPLVAQALGGEGLHPWRLSQAKVSGEFEDRGMETAMSAAFSRLKAVSE